MPFKIVRNDITKVKADAIVNTANSKSVIGSGTDSAIYKAAGKKRLFAERKKIGDIALGDAVSTAAFDLNAKYVIHTVGPAWIDGDHEERKILRDCYRNSLSLAASLQCKSIAFPLIATGTYGFPKAEALQIALEEINEFLLSHDMKVILVVFDRKAFELSGRLVGEIEEYIDEHSAREIYIDEHSAREIRKTEYAGRYENRRRMEGRHRLGTTAIFGSVGDAFEEEKPDGNEDNASSVIYADGAGVSFPDIAGKSLDEVLENTEDTFQQRLFKLIDESGMTDVTVYKKANVDRKVFSRIRCKEDYKPKKKTAVAFAIALRLDMPTMLDLLSRAGIAFSPSNKFDLIIAYFVTNKIYDIYEINAALFKYGQPILGE